MSQLLFAGISTWMRCAVQSRAPFHSQVLHVYICEFERFKNHTGGGSALPGKLKQLLYSTVGAAEKAFG